MIYVNSIWPQSSIGLYIATLPAILEDPSDSLEELESSRLSEEQLSDLRKITAALHRAVGLKFAPAYKSRQPGERVI